jgi:hypothetical protein
MRRLSLKEFTICVAAGVLLGLLFRPGEATAPGSPLTPGEINSALSLAVAGGLVVPGLYWLLVWRKGW